MVYDEKDWLIHNGLNQDASDEWMNRINYLNRIYRINKINRIKNKFFSILLILQILLEQFFYRLRQPAAGDAIVGENFALAAGVGVFVGDAHDAQRAIQPGLHK